MKTSGPAADEDDRSAGARESSTTPLISSRRQIMIFAVLLPAITAASNQALLKIADPRELRLWFYPWLILSTAALSWYTGRYLRPMWLALLVFAWSCALLDFLTIALCLSGPIDRRFAFALVSAQIGLIALWGILETTNWQWRLPAVFATVPAVVVFAGVFARSSGWIDVEWFILLLLTTAVIIAVCGSLRVFGFFIRRNEKAGPKECESNSLQIYQFGLKHMMCWAAAMVPLLLVGRGFDFLIVRNVGAPGTFQVLVLAVCVALTNLAAIWAVLGRGVLILRLVVLIFLPLLLGAGVNHYAKYVHSVFTYNPRRFVYPELILDLFSTQLDWTAWLWLDAALLAALLLYLRAVGYRLARKAS